MSAPNKTVANFRKKFGTKPEVVASVEQRMSSDDMVEDMNRFQQGLMTAEQSKNKWSNSNMIKVTPHPKYVIKMVLETYINPHQITRMVRVKQRSSEYTAITLVDGYIEYVVETPQQILEQLRNT